MYVPHLGQTGIRIYVRLQGRWEMRKQSKINTERGREIKCEPETESYKVCPEGLEHPEFSWLRTPLILVCVSIAPWLWKTPHKTFHYLAREGRDWICYFVLLLLCCGNMILTRMFFFFFFLNQLHSQFHTSGFFLPLSKAACRSTRSASKMDSRDGFWHARKPSV